MKKYENYKDSGLEWLGMVPEHWEIDKLKYQFGLVTAPSESSNKIGLENIESATGRFIKTDSDFEGNGIAFLPNDIVYGKLRPYLQKVWLAEFSGSAVGDFYVFRCNEGTYPVYVKYLLLSHNFTVEADGSTYGAKMPRVSYEFVANLKWAMPPLSEQRTIASYLDHKVRLIDALISEKEKMVEDLKAYRSSLITETVTKGLNKEVKMKDSGVEWIGKIPQNWKLLKLKRIVNLKSGTSLTSDRILDEGKYQVFGGNGPRGYIDDYTNEGNFVLIGRQGALCGNINYANGKFWATEHAIICYPLKEIDTIWLGETLRAMNLNQYSISAAQPGLAVERINELLIPTPSISEQKEISSYLKLKITQIESAISEQEHQLSDLKSYKSSLITEAVTGKIDLRDWQTKKS